MHPLIAGAIVVLSSAPPLSPADAVQVLRNHHSLLDRTDARSVDLDGPRVVVVPASPGPFGPFAPPVVSVPTNPTITFRLPGGHRGKTSH
jgi:hypothetical protein